MEKFWNIIHWVIYKFWTKSFLYPIKIYNTSLARKILKKNGRTPQMAKEEVKFFLTDVKFGENLYYAELVIFIVCVALLFSVETICLVIFNKQMPQLAQCLALLVINIILTVLFNNLLLFRKNKYIKYFKQFEKQPHTWKVKWAWISAVVILFPFLLLAGCFWVMAR